MGTVGNQDLAQPPDVRREEADEIDEQWEALAKSGCPDFWLFTRCVTAAARQYFPFKDASTTSCSPPCSPQPSCGRFPSKQGQKDQSQELALHKAPAQQPAAAAVTAAAAAAVGTAAAGDRPAGADEAAAGKAPEAEVEWQGCMGGCFAGKQLAKEA